MYITMDKYIMYVYRLVIINCESVDFLYKTPNHILGDLVVIKLFLRCHCIKVKFKEKK